MHHDQAGLYLCSFEEADPPHKQALSPAPQLVVHAFLMCRCSINDHGGTTTMPHNSASYGSEIHYLPSQRKN
jgi:hypothetical protein